MSGLAVHERARRRSDSDRGSGLGSKLVDGESSPPTVGVLYELDCLRGQLKRPPRERDQGDPILVRIDTRISPGYGRGGDKYPIIEQADVFDIQVPPCGRRR